MKTFKKQQGFALFLIAILLATAAATVTVKALKHRSGYTQIARDRITADALAQAKEALIGYAATYRDNHPSEVFGYLPLPDLGSSRNQTPDEGNAAGNFPGNHTNLTVIGKLPWRTLGLSPLRDGQGECLWYAVSGSFQNTQKADVLNWDSLGHLDAYSSNGTSSGTVSTTGANYAQRPVAIIFSASAVLPGQNRQKSATDTVSTCGGNYDARNYLDPFNTDTNINNIVNYFAGSTNNSTGYAYNLTSVSDGSQLSATDLAAPKNIIFGDIEVVIAGNRVKISNDRILTVTVDDIFRPVMQRTDFKDQIYNLLNDHVFITYLKTVTISGTKGTDRIDCDNTDHNISGNKKFCNNWKEMLLLTNLPSSASIIIDGMATPICNRVLIFGGQKTGTQVRLTATDKNNPANYLEGGNLSGFATPTSSHNSFNGASPFSASNPSADLLSCIP